MAQLIKNLPAIRETWVQSLGWDPLEKGKAGYPLQCFGLENSMDCIIHGCHKNLVMTERISFSKDDIRSKVEWDD